MEAHRVILADPPWQHNNYGMAKHGAAKANYEEMPLDEIAAIPVSDWAADPCALFLWSTGPQGADTTPHALMRAWGFRPVTRAFTWVKARPKCRTCGHDWGDHEDASPDPPGRCGRRLYPDSPLEHACKCEAFAVRLYAGTGNYTMGGTEDVWLGVRGSGLARDRLARNVRHTVIAPPPTHPGTKRTRHSAKPEAVQDRIERLWPGPRLELFARRHRPGWTCLGLELGHRLTSDGVEQDVAGLDVPRLDVAVEPPRPGLFLG